MNLSLHENLPCIPVSVDLKGAREFRLVLKAVGERGPIYQEEWDQADWADARVVAADGTTVNLSSLPVGPLPRAFSNDPPFSFRYGGQESWRFLSDWTKRYEMVSDQKGVTLHRIVYRDPKTGEACVPNSPELPLPLDKVYPVNEIVRVDYSLPGCPPSGDAIWKFLTDLILGRMPRLDYSLLNYD